MHLPRVVVDLLHDVANFAYYEGYSKNSNIVAGLRDLARMIADEEFSQESCNWVARSIVPEMDNVLYYFHNMRHVFPDNVFYNYVMELIYILFRRVNAIPYDFEPNPVLQIIFDCPGGEYNLAILEDYYIDTDSESELDDDDDEVPIDPEGSPEYEEFPDPPPLYENIHQDELLVDALPLYSEFSLRTMQMSMDRSSVSIEL